MRMFGNKFVAKIVSIKRWILSAGKESTVCFFLVLCIVVTISLTLRYGDKKLSFWGSLSDSPALMISFLSMLLAYWAVTATNRVADKASALDSMVRRREIEKSDCTNIVAINSALTEVRLSWDDSGVWDALYANEHPRFSEKVEFTRWTIRDFVYNPKKPLNLDVSKVKNFTVRGKQSERWVTVVPWSKEVEDGRRQLRHFAYRVLSLYDSGGLTLEDAKNLLAQISITAYEVAETLDALYKALCYEPTSLRGVVIKCAYDYELYYRVRKILLSVTKAPEYRDADLTAKTCPDVEFIALVDSNGRPSYPNVDLTDFVEPLRFCRTRPIEHQKELLNELMKVDVEKVRQGTRRQKIKGRFMTVSDIVVWKYTLVQSLHLQEPADKYLDMGVAKAYDEACKRKMWERIPLITDNHDPFWDWDESV